MSSKKRTRQRWWVRVTVCMAAGIFFCAASLSAQTPQRTVRSLSGTITDSGHEPIRNAVVQLRNEANNEIITYITDKTGSYDFKRLNGDTDYDVWVEFRGKHSVTRNISKFDSHMTKVINFTVRTF